MSVLYIIGVILLIRFIKYATGKRKDEEVKKCKKYEELNDEANHGFINEYPKIEYPKEENKTGMKEEKEKLSEEIAANTRNLMIETLKLMGCDPKEIDDGAVYVVYQGEKFFMKFGGLFVNIWDLGWSNINVNDLNLPKVRQAINLTNFEFGPTVVLTEPDENGNMQIHTRYGIVFHSSLPDLTEYLSNTLGLFFRAKKDMHQNYNRLIAE